MSNDSNGGPPGWAPPQSLLLALSAPRSGIVVGPPGSGKTAMALQLASEAAIGGRVQFLVASQHLVAWLQDRLETPAVEVKTWRGWLGETYQGIAGTTYPIKKRGSQRSVDWDKVMLTIERGAPQHSRQVIVDEAQDVPARLFLALVKHEGNVIAFADPYQRHVNEGSTIERMVDALALDHPWPVYVLEEDYRTTMEIQRFSTAAWAPERLDPARPARNRGPVPSVTTGGFEAVALEAKRLMDKQVGSVTVASSQADRAKIAAALRAIGLEPNRGAEADPNKVSVLAFEALRGLEFDSVVLVPHGSSSNRWNEAAADLYVASTRARRELSLVLVHPSSEELTRSLERASIAMGTT